MPPSSSPRIPSSSNLTTASSSPISRVTTRLRRRQRRQRRTRTRGRALTVTGHGSHHHLQVKTNLLTTSDLITTITVRDTVSSSHVTCRDRRRLSLRLRHFRSREGLTRRTSQVPLATPGRLGPSTRKVSLRRRKRTLVERDTRCPNRIRTLIRTLRLNCTLGTRLPTTGTRDSQLALRGCPTCDPVLTLQVAADSLVGLPSKRPHGKNGSRAGASSSSKLDDVRSGNTTLFSLIRRPFIGRLFTS